MGMTIEKCLLYEMCKYKTAPCAVCKPDKGCSIYRYFKELIIQNYNARLKADMVAILTDIQLEIEENSYSENVYGDEYGIDQVISTDEIYQFIQQKIDALKENTDGSNTN